ncbi:MAG: alpha/beta hydrolase [Gemmatimonadota bacterium]
MNRGRLLSMVALSSAIGALSAQGQERRLAYLRPAMDQVTRIADLRYRSLEGTSDTVMYGTDLRYDVFLPPGPIQANRPGVIFIHGGMVAGTARVSPKDDLPAYREWGRLVASAGLVGITFSHRLTTQDNVDLGAQDVEELLRAIRRRASEWGLDPGRLCVAAYSAGGPLSSLFLRPGPDPVRCIVLFYPFLDVDHAAMISPFRAAHPAERVAELQRYSPRAQVLSSGGQLPPIFLARAGRDAIPGINASIDRFVQAALWVNAPLDLYVHRTGPHGFDMIAAPDPRATEIVSAALDFLVRHTR